MTALAFLAMAAPVEGSEVRARAIAAARAGDLAAFETLMRQYERMVLVTAMRLLGNVEDAKDASQEVFLRLYRNLGKVEASNNFSGWLYRVTVNVCYDIGRKRTTAVPMDEAPDVVSAGADPQEAATSAERQRVLAMSLRTLSQKERAALVLRDLEGLSTEEVARALGSSEATVRSQISKARVKVRDFVERYFRRRV
jgi:RNA polymerase sigma-70 factor (ECF subfamily)